MNRVLWLFLALSAAAFGADLEIFTVVGTTETPAPAVVDVGTGPAGDQMDLRFRLRNSTAESVTLAKLYVLGSGFSMYGAPSLPYIVAPGTNVDFLVRFRGQTAGSYSANLLVNTQSLLVHAAALPSLTISVDGTSVTAGAVVDFGKIERGQKAVRALTLQNPGTVDLPVKVMAVSGACFSVSGPGTPLVIAPGQTIDFKMACQPAKSGLQNGTLQLDGRALSLTAFATEPTAPRPTLRLLSSAITSAQQVEFEIALAEPSRAIVSGTVSLEFPDAKDEAILFPSSGKPVLPFQVKEGDTQVRFGESTRATFQTGTTSGNLKVNVEMGGYTDRATIAIAPAGVVVDTARVLRETGSITVHTNGYDNTRSLSQIVFTFYDKAGTALPSAPIRVDTSADFRKWYDGSTLGGLFALKAVFPVSGDASQVSGVDLEIHNSAGTTRTERIRF